MGVLDETYSADYKVRLKLPPLVAHTKDIYKKEGKLSKRLKENFRICIVWLENASFTRRKKKSNCNLSPNLHLNEMEQIHIKWYSKIRIERNSPGRLEWPESDNT